MQPVFGCAGVFGHRFVFLLVPDPEIRLFENTTSKGGAMVFFCSGDEYTTAS